MRLNFFSNSVCRSKELVMVNLRILMLESSHQQTSGIVSPVKFYIRILSFAKNDFSNDI
jgi:hypothetical protein